MGTPDRRKRLPVLVRLLSDQALLIEPDDAREVISCVHRDGESRYAIGPSRRSMAEAVRRARLAKLCQLLDEAGRILTAMPADNAVLDQLKAISHWVKSQVDNIPLQP